MTYCTANKKGAKVKKLRKKTLKVCSKNAVKLFLCSILIAVSIFSLSACSKDAWQQRDRIQELTAVEIPTDTDVLYHFFDNSFANGRHRQFTVYEFKTEPIEWLNENSFSNQKNTEMEEDFFDDEWKASTLGAGEIPKEYIPNFENSYYWLITQRVYFFYFPDTLLLIVLVPSI